MKDVTVYVNKDGRARAYIKETKKVVSYPRLVVEHSIGCHLRSDQQVHHIDGNPLNNHIDNLEIVPLGEHQRYHKPHIYHDIEVTCAICGEPFLWTAKQQSNWYRNRRRSDRNDMDSNGPTCSVSCARKQGRMTQLKNRNGAV